MKKKDSNKKVSVWAIYIIESNPPENEIGISWMLLTTLPVHSFEDACEKLHWYTIRWNIEIFHKIIKSCNRIEDRQTRSIHALTVCLILDMIVSWRIFFLTLYSRVYPNQKCSVHFNQEDWQCVFNCLNNKKQSFIPSIYQMIRLLAQIGGFLARKLDGEPGPLSVSRGLVELSTMRQILNF